MDYNSEDFDQVLEQYISGTISFEEFIIQEGIGDIVTKVKKEVSRVTNYIKGKIKKHPVVASSILLVILTILVHKKYEPKLAKKLQELIKKEHFKTSMLVGDFTNVKTFEKQMEALVYSLATDKEGVLRTNIVKDIKDEGYQVTKVMTQFAKERKKLIKKIESEGGVPGTIEKEISRKFNQIMIDAGILKITAPEIPMFQGLLSFKRLASVGIPSEAIKPIIIKLIKGGVTGRKGEILPGALEVITPKTLGKRDSKYFDQVVVAIAKAIEQATGSAPEMRVKPTRVRKSTAPSGEPSKTSLYVGADPDDLTIYPGRASRQPGSIRTSNINDL